MRSFVVAITVAALLCGTALASPARTNSSTVLRATPDPKAKALQTIPANATIDLTNCSPNWCEVGWHNQVGYVTASSVVYVPEAPTPSAQPASPAQSGTVFSLPFSSLPFSVQIGGSDAGPSFQEPGVRCSGVARVNC